MKKRGISIVAFALLASACLATAAARDTAAADKAAIMKLEQRWLGAIKTGDRKALEPILADDFIDINAQGRMRGKAEVIADSNAPAGTSQSITGLNVRVWGDTAVAVGVNQVHSNDKGWTIELPFTDTFARVHGHWRAVSSQETMRRPGAAH